MSARDIAIYLREDCRTLRDSLQLEMVAAQYWLRLRDVCDSGGLPVGVVVGPGVVAELEREGDALSHAILRAMADVGTGETATRSAEAVARLGEGAVALPREFADVAESRAVGAWRAREGGADGEYALFAEFEHPRGRRHTIGLFVTPDRGGVVKHLGLLGPMDEVGAEEAFRLEPLSFATAGAMMSEVLERTDGPSAAGTDDFRALIAAARARSMARPSSGAAAAA